MRSTCAAATVLVGLASTSAFLVTAPRAHTRAAPVRMTMPQELETVLDPSRSWDVELTLNGVTKVVNVPEGTSILEASELVFDDPPHMCRNGVCSECAGHIDEGMDSLMMAVSGLGQELRGEGFALTCQTYPAGAGVKVTLGQTDTVYGEQYGKHSEEEHARKLAGKSASVFGMF